MHLVNMLNRYEAAHREALKLISTQDVPQIRHPLTDSAKFYKRRVTEIKQQLDKLNETELK